VLFSDELRLGLHGQTRTGLAPRGVTVRQPLQVAYPWRYLLLAVEPRAGRLVWRWLPRMRQEHLKPVLEEWHLAGVVWDGAPSHRGRSLQELATRRVLLPPYRPARNPAERIFAVIRGRVEGTVYESITAKQHPVEV
jgi:hypothetical protein